MNRMPETRHEMTRAYYKGPSSPTTCRGCGAAIEWWTTTNKRKLPINIEPAGEDVPVVPHRATCPKAKDFKVGNTDIPTARPLAVASDRRHAVAALQRETGARVVAAIFDDGAQFAWRPGLDGENLRQELITAGNFVRNEIQKREQQ